MKADPLGEPRNPLAIYLLILTLISGLGTAFGVPSSGSIESELPEYLARAWGIILFFGSAATLLGIFWQGDVRTGLVLKRVGTFTLTVASLVYGTVLLVAAQMDAALAAGMVYGFSAACALQFLKINRRIQAIIQASR